MRERVPIFSKKKLQLDPFFFNCEKIVMNSLSADEASLIVAFLTLDALVHISRVNCAFHTCAIDRIKKHIRSLLRQFHAGPFGIRPQDIMNVTGIYAIRKLYGADALNFRKVVALGALCNLKTLSIHGFAEKVGMKDMFDSIASGSMASLQWLYLSNNKIKDAGMSALAGAIASGSLGSLQWLFLNSNQIGDAGMAEFSRAISSGSLASLVCLDLDDNRIGDAGMTDLSRAISSGSLAALEKLYLSMNKIGDAGMAVFAGAISSGSLKALTTLRLSSNNIGDAGMAELSRAIASGSLGKLSLASLFVGVDHPQLKAACQQRGITLR